MTAYYSYFSLVSIVRILGIDFLVPLPIVFADWLLVVYLDIV